MRPHTDFLFDVCGHWLPARPTAVRPCASLGWSGAPLFVVAANGREFILKRFGPTGSRQHAEWVHAVMRQCRQASITQVPEVMLGRDGTSVHEDPAGGLWELLERMPGTAVADPTPVQRNAAAATVAAIHLAAARLPGHAPYPAPSPGVERRRAQAAALVARPWSEWPAIGGVDPLAARLRRAAAIIAEHDGPRALARVAAFDPGPLLVQPVLRDVWGDHVLFVGDRVAAIIDWHAAGVDTPATDLARLVGSWPAPAEHGDDFLDAYSRLRPLSAQERGLVGFFAAAGVVCAVDNWLRWTVEERRRFADMTRVVDRVDRLLARLPEAIAELARGGTHAASWG